MPKSQILASYYSTKPFAKFADGEMLRGPYIHIHVNTQTRRHERTNVQRRRACTGAWKNRSADESRKHSTEDQMVLYIFRWRGHLNFSPAETYNTMCGLCLEMWIARHAKIAKTGHGCIWYSNLDCTHHDFHEKATLSLEPRILFSRKGDIISTPRILFVKIVPNYLYTTNYDFYEKTWIFEGQVFRLSWEDKGNCLHGRVDLESSPLMMRESEFA